MWQNYLAVSPATLQSDANTNNTKVVMIESINGRDMLTFYVLPSAAKTVKMHACHMSKLSMLFSVLIIEPYKKFMQDKSKLVKV